MAAIDATGLEVRHVSLCYRIRRGEAKRPQHRRRAWPKLTAVVHTQPEFGLRVVPFDMYMRRLWWYRAGLPTDERFGFHAARRQFASELKHLNLKDLCALGGWRSPQTILTCYVQADEATQREALATRKEIRQESDLSRTRSRTKIAGALTRPRPVRAHQEKPPTLSSPKSTS